MEQTILLDGCRTPFQKAGTGYRDALSYQLAQATIRGLLERNELDPASVDRVIFGAIVPNPRTTNVAREAALTAGIPPTVPALTLVAAGASATSAIAYGSDLIATGQAEVVIAGGTDCVSDAPILFRRPMRNKLLAARRLRGIGAKLRFLLGLRPWDFLPDVIDATEFTTGKTMGEYTEELARRLKISRKEQDTYAARSHRRAGESSEFLGEEIVPFQTADGTLLQQDNGVRPGTTAEDLARLRPAFTAGGTLTAGNSSYLTDGASAILLMSRSRAEAQGIKSGFLLRGSALTAHDPREDLLLGPVFAIPQVLEQAGVSFSEIDIFEIHEAFAAQILAVLRLLEERMGERIPEEKLNAWGGSLALGNPFAPNGARLITTAMHRLAVEEKRLAVVATCAGGGLGQAMILERLQLKDRS